MGDHLRETEALGAPFLTVGPQLQKCRSHSNRAPQLQREVALISCETVGNSRPPIEQAGIHRDLATIRFQISDTAFADAQARGCAMAMDLAIARALGR